MTPSPFSRAFLVLALFMVASSCGKSTSDRLPGNWKLAFRSPTPPGPLRIGPEILTLRNDHTYTLKLHDSVASSGTYHVGQQGTPAKSIIYFSTDEANGYFVRFDRDSLVLTYAGLMNALFTPPISKYVRL